MLDIFFSLKRHLFYEENVVIFSNLRLKEYTHIHTIYTKRDMQIFVKTRAFLFSLSLCFLLFLRFFFLFVCSKVVVVFLFLSLSLEDSDLVKTRKNWTKEESAFDDDDDARRCSRL